MSNPYLSKAIDVSSPMDMCKDLQDQGPTLQLVILSVTPNIK